MNGKKGFTLSEFTIVLAVVCIIGVIAVTGTSGLSTGDGDRVGIITKLSYRGIHWKTWEGQMILGGQGTVTTNVWEFSVTDPEVLEKVRAALNTQQKVRLSYHQNLMEWPWLGSTTYFITAVNAVN